MGIWGNILNFIKAFFSLENYTFKNLALATIVIFCTQYTPIEGYGISTFKVAFMSAMILVFLLNFRLSKAVALLFILFLIKFSTAYFVNGSSFRSSTMMYSLLFFITYATFYNIVWVERAVSLESFIKFLKAFIYTLGAILILQQLFIIVGIKSVPLINLTYVLKRGGLSAYSLSLEPSHFARVLGVLYYAYLKCNEFQQGHSVNIQQIFNPYHRWITLLFAWSMFTMGSGTAFICLGVLSFYFMKGAYFVFAIPICIGVYFTLSYFEVKQFERARISAEATLTGDVDEVRETDGSAASRIEPLLNTIHNLDFNKSETWFGYGIDHSVNARFTRGKRMIGGIEDFGLISYLAGMTFIYTCCIEFFSLGNVMLWTGIGGGTGNIAYQWGLLCLFSFVRYFHHCYKNKVEDFEEVE